MRTSGFPHGEEKSGAGIRGWGAGQGWGSALAGHQGAHVHAELLGQLVLVQGFALVQAGQDGRQAVGQFFAFGVGCWVGRHGGMNGLWVALERL